MDRGLIERLNDQHDETRGEALVALARLGDERVIAQLLRLLTNEVLWTLEIEAASACADPRLYPQLEEIEKWWEGRDEIQLALHRCHPDAGDRAKAFEELLLTRLGELNANTSIKARIHGVYPRSVLITEVAGKHLDEWPLWDDADPFTDVDVEKEAQQWNFNVDLAMGRVAE